MIRWLLWRAVRHAPRRVVLESIAVGIPVAMLAATLLFVDAAVQSMTPHALAHVQVEFRAIAKSLDTAMSTVSANLGQVPGVTLAEPFASAKVVVSSGTSGQVTARLFAVDPAYLADHPWVHVVSGSLNGGALLDQSMLQSPEFAAATDVTIALPGDAPPLTLTLPVSGIVDLRAATPWFAIPYGAVQGDIATVPRSLIIDFHTFEREVLPALRTWAAAGGLPPFDPGSDQLASASLESHVSVDHAAYPPDPGQAVVWSGQLQRALGRAAGAPVVLADDAVEVLVESQDDATNAKILFLLLGIPGLIVAAALGLACASTLVEAYRRESALLRIRGMTDRQVARLATANAALAGVVGSLVGLVLAVALVSVATGRPVWLGSSPTDLALSMALAVLAGMLITALRIIRVSRSDRHADVVLDRRSIVGGWSPAWRRMRLDIVAVVVGIGILVINQLVGGLQQGPIAGQSLALSFYVLLAPIALWLGITLLLVRVLMSFLSDRARSTPARPMTTWRATAVRWLGRRPAQAASALALGALTVAFGTQVLAFTATYQTAREADAQAAIGADLRLIPGNPRFVLPPLGPDVVAVSPVHVVPARADTDRKTVLAIDLATWTATVGIAPRMLAGSGPEALRAEPNGVLIDKDTADSFQVGPGDLLPLTFYPDDFENASDRELRVLGVFAAFPPTAPVAEIITTVGSVPRSGTIPPDFYLARVGPGRTAESVAAALRSGPLSGTFQVVTAVPAGARGLTALSLGGLSGMEAVMAAIVAAVGVAVLGAFIALERRREFAILRSLGAARGQVMTGPVVEGSVVVLGSIAIGVPVGLALAALSVQILGLFFALPPPPLTVPLTELVAFVGLMAVGSGIALGITLSAVDRVRPASVLRET